MALTLILTLIALIQTGILWTLFLNQARLCMYFSIRFALSFFIPVVTWAYVSRVKAAV